MTRRYFVAGSLALLTLALVGCSKDRDKDSGGKTVSGPIKETGVPDKDDFIDEEKDYHGEWDTAEPVELTSAIMSQYSMSSSGFLDRDYMQRFEDYVNAVRTGTTYGTRNGNRQAFRLIPAFGSGRTALVTFSDMPKRGYRVRLGRASRVNSGPDRGFVFKNGSIGGYFAHSPYGRHPRGITVYY